MDWRARGRGDILDTPRFVRTFFHGSYVLSVNVCGPREEDLSHD